MSVECKAVRKPEATAPSLSLLWDAPRGHDLSWLPECFLAWPDNESAEGQTRGHSIMAASPDLKVSLFRAGEPFRGRWAQPSHFQFPDEGSDSSFSTGFPTSFCVDRVLSVPCAFPLVPFSDYIAAQPIDKMFWVQCSGSPDTVAPHWRDTGPGDLDSLEYRCGDC